jgi:glycerate kinase
MAPSRILIVPDKFKGTLTARQAATAIAAGWGRARPDDTLDLLPMSDGGDGFGEVVGELLGAKVRTTATVDAAHRPIEAAWWWHQPSATAVVESAGVIGLAQLPAGVYEPFDLDTFGLGAVLEAARGVGARRCLIGIGGSATNDGGFGLARALGWRFIDEVGDAIEQWTDLDRLAAVRPPGATRWFDELTVAVDVRNPLLGPEGSSRTYGPQKGLTEFDKAERCLERLAAVMADHLGIDHSPIAGAGAAGGLGFGLAVFAGAELIPGFRVFADLSNLGSRMVAVDLVITGEGALDAQTLMGKGVGEAAAMARGLGVPCLALAGVIREAGSREAFTSALALTPDLTGPDEAMSEPGSWLERLAASAASGWSES